MAIKAVTMDSVEEYVSDADPAKGTETEDKDATKFLLGAISARQMSRIKDAATSFRQDPNDEGGDDVQVMAEFKPNESTYLTVQHGLRGWKNLLDEAGNEVPFATTSRVVGGRTVQVASDESMDMLGEELTRELAERLQRNNTPKEADLGN